MMFKSIRSRLALSFAGIALVAALALGAVLLAILRNYYSNQELNYLRLNAQSVSTVLAAMTSAHAPHDQVQSQVENLAFLTQTRIQVYSLEGQVLYDSGSPQNLKVNLSVARQTLIQSNTALPKDKIFITIGSPPNNEFPFPGTVSKPVPEELTSKNVFVYHSAQAGDSAYGFALKLPGDPSPVIERSNSKIGVLMQDPKTNNELGSVQLSEGPAYGSAILASVARGWIFAGGIAVFLAAVIGWYISHRISTPVLALTGVTTRMMQGDLSSRADVKSRDEFGQLACSFNEMAEQVEQTVSTLREFVADAAHELHTPLTALQANLELACDENNISARTRYLSRAQEQGQRLEALVKSLLDLSRVEANKSTSGFKLINLTQLVREIGEQFASRAEQSERSFTLIAPNDTVNVRGNELQLRQVIINLLENALKFTPAAGWVSLQLEPTKDEVILTVSDSGIGIPLEDLPHIFERFHRARNVAEYPGNGLGLAIVQAIVKSQGGQVSVRSNGVGQGSEFTVKLTKA